MTTETKLPSIDLASTVEAVPVTISSQEDLKQATIVLSNLNKYLDSIVEYKERKTKPLNEALKVIRSETKPYESAIQAHIDDIRSKMTAYQTNLINTTKQAELAIASRIAPGKGNLTLETAVKKLSNLPQAEKEVATDAGLVQFREKKQLLIINVDEIPREYMLPNETLLLENLKKGKVIYGVILETIQVPVNYR